MRTLHHLAQGGDTLTALPDFFVIGAYKSGTTSLHQYLHQHPDLYLPSRKEPNFFAFDGNPDPDRRVAAGSVTQLRDYEALFAGNVESKVAGEVSPEYMVNPWAAPRIRARCPSAKLIAVLRHPVDRAYSDYLMYVRDGLERCGSFMDALELQDERWARGEPTGAYLRTGTYGAQLRRYLELFPRSQICVHRFENLRDDPQITMDSIFRFLGVRPVTLEVSHSYNASGVPRNGALRAAFRLRHRASPLVRWLLPDAARPRLERLARSALAKPALELGSRRELTEYYREDIVLLQELTGMDLSSWLDDLNDSSAPASA